MAKKKRGSSFADTLKGAFMPQNKETIKSNAAAPNRAEIDRNNALMNQPKATPAPKKEPKLERFVIDQDTGKASGIRDPITGKVTFLPPEDIAAIQKKDDVANQVTERAIQENDVVKKENNQIIAEQAVQNLGQEVAPDPELTNFNNRLGTDLALNAGAFAGAAGSVAGGLGLGTAAAGGAAAGSILPGIGTAVGALAAIGIVLGRIALAKRNVVKRADNAFDESVKSNKFLLNLANQGQTDPTELVGAYNQNYANIMASYKELREQTKTKTGQSLSGAQEELGDIEIYLRDEQLRRDVFMRAILQPNPSAIFPDTEVNLSND